MAPRSTAKKDKEEQNDVSMSEAPASAQQTASVDDDQSMEYDAAMEDQAGDEFDENEEEEEYDEDDPQGRVPTIRDLAVGTDTAMSFEFLHEGHTLGNALRWIIMKNPDVEFCAYAIPHPAEEKMNLRIQTYEGTSTAVEALLKGLRDLQDLADVVTEKFKTAKEEFEDRMTS